MIQLNDDSIFVGQIKQILKDFNLPVCQIGEENKLPNNFYIKNNDIYFCDKEDNSTKIESYIYNKKYLNFTKNLELNSLLYDSYTHRYLGDYLRFIRDYHHINLMSMYNLCDRQSIDKDVKILETIIDETEEDKEETTNVVETLESNSNSTVTFTFPVRHRQKYTIWAPKSGRVSIGFRLIGTFDKLHKTNNDIMLESLEFRDCSQPYVYTKLNDFDINSCELNGYIEMFIKTSNRQSTIVVLEGDYTQSSFDSVDSLIPTKLQLLSYQNVFKSYLLADRLVEYLTNNVISPISESYDIIKLQKELVHLKYLDKDIYGLWTEDLSNALKQFIIDYNIYSNYYDIIGYCDKDVESELLRIDSTRSGGVVYGKLQV